MIKRRPSLTRSASIRAWAAARKGVPHPEMARSHYPCNCHGPEARAKRVAAHTGQKRREGTGERISAGLKASEKAAARHACQRGVPRPLETRLKIGAAQRGRVFAPEQLAHMRQAGRRRYQRPCEAEKMIAALAKGREAKGPTWLERALARLLTEAGFAFEEQAQRGAYYVDAWVPEHRLIFEADGAYWHQNSAKERARDAYLLRGGAVAVIHLTEDDLQSFKGS